MTLTDTFLKNVETIIAGALQIYDAMRWAQPAMPAKTKAQDGKR